MVKPFQHFKQNATTIYIILNEYAATGVFFMEQTNLIQK